MGITYTETLSDLNKLSSFDTATDNYNIYFFEKSLMGYIGSSSRTSQSLKILYQIRDDKLVTTGR